MPIIMATESTITLVILENWPSMAETFTTNFRLFGDFSRRCFSFDVKMNGAIELMVIVCKSSCRGTSVKPRFHELVGLRRMLKRVTKETKIGYFFCTVLLILTGNFTKYNLTTKAVEGLGTI